jgi:hypothetical protein
MVIIQVVPATPLFQTPMRRITNMVFFGEDCKNLYYGIFFSSCYMTAKHFSRLLTQVSNNTRWKVGLHVVMDHGIYVVESITYSTGNSGDTSIAEKDGNNYILYCYAGSQIEVEPMEVFPVYCIALRQITPGKVGGGRRPNYAPISMRRQKNIFQSADGDAPGFPSETTDLANISC